MQSLPTLHHQPPVSHCQTHRLDCSIPGLVDWVNQLKGWICEGVAILWNSLLAMDCRVGKEDWRELFIDFDCLLILWAEKFMDTVKSLWIPVPCCLVKCITVQIFIYRNSLRERNKTKKGRCHTRCTCKCGFITLRVFCYVPTHTLRGVPGGWEANLLRRVKLALACMLLACFLQ